MGGDDYYGGKDIPEYINHTKYQTSVSNLQKPVFMFIISLTTKNDTLFSMNNPTQHQTLHMGSKNKRNYTCRCVVASLWPQNSWSLGRDKQEVLYMTLRLHWEVTLVPSTS